MRRKGQQHDSLADGYMGSDGRLAQQMLRLEWHWVPLAPKAAGQQARDDAGRCGS